MLKPTLLRPQRHNIRHKYESKMAAITADANFHMVDLTLGMPMITAYRST